MQKTSTNKTYFVYKITNLINNKVYIGKSGGSENKRFSDHIYTSKNPNCKSYSYLHSAIAKYKEDNFVYEIIGRYSSEEEAYFHEEKYIAEYNALDNEFGYNLASGGKHGKHTPESIDKIRQKRIGFKFSKESIEKMRISHLGQKNSKRMFTENEIVQIRTAYHMDSLLKKKDIVINLANKFECSKATMAAIVRYSSYKEIVVPIPTLPSDSKACTVCNLALNISQFNNDSRYDDGKCGRCRSCESKIKRRHENGKLSK